MKQGNEKMSIQNETIETQIGSTHIQLLTRKGLNAY